MLFLALFSALSTFACPHPTQESPGRQLSQELFKNFRGQAPKNLKSLRVEFIETLPSTPRKKAKLLSKSTFSMAFPHQCRVEETIPGEGLRIYLWEGKKLLMGTSGGPFVTIEGEARRRILGRFHLLAALFCWDLFPTSPTSSRPKTPALKLEGNTLHSVLNLGEGIPGIPIQRVFGLGRRILKLVVGTKRYSAGGRLPGTLATHPGILRSLPGPRIQIRSWASGFNFKPQLFRPREPQLPKQSLVQQGGEEENFAAPRLKQLPAAFEIGIKDPGNWKARAQLLDKLGRQLFALGQEPAGLPLYGADGKIRIQFVPSEGKKAQAPKGMEMRRLKKRRALVLYRRGPFAETMDSLGRDLRERAKKMGMKKAGTFLVIPTFFPNPAGPFPGPKAPITLRGELLLEG